MGSLEIRSLTRAWLCCGFLIEEDNDATDAEVFVPEDNVPILFLPVGWDADQCDYAAGWAIASLFEQRYGWLALVRGIRSWDAIVEDMGRPAGESAAD